MLDGAQVTWAAVEAETHTVQTSRCVSGDWRVVWCLTLTNSPAESEHTVCRRGLIRSRWTSRRPRSSTTSSSSDLQSCAIQTRESAASHCSQTLQHLIWLISTLSHGGKLIREITVLGRNGNPSGLVGSLFEAIALISAALLPACHRCSERSNTKTKASSIVNISRLLKWIGSLTDCIMASETVSPHRHSVMVRILPTKT